MDQRALAELNDILRVELGDDPLYAWDTVRTRKLLWPCRKLDRVTGRPELNYRCACGVNVSVHSPSCNSLVLPEPAYEMRHYFDGHPNAAMRRYFEAGGYICVSRQRFSKSYWQAQYGALPYMEELWTPAVVETIGCVVTPRGQYPTADLTRHFIAIVQKHRTLTPQQLEDELNELQEKREKARIAERHEELNELTIGPRGSRAAAGKVDGPVSLPTVTPKSKSLIEVVQR